MTRYSGAAASIALGIFEKTTLLSRWKGYEQGTTTSYSYTFLTNMMYERNVYKDAYRLPSPHLDRNLSRNYLFKMLRSTSTKP